MRLFYRLYSPEGASGGEGAAGVTSADAGQSTGETSEAAAQNMESRLEQLGVPREKIRKGAYKRNVPAPAPTIEPEPEEEVPESGAADRKSWEDIKAEYKADLDAEVQNIVQKRVKKEQERAQQLADRFSKIAPMVDFFSEKYGQNADDPDLDALIQKFREDNSLSEAKAMEMGTTDEIAHRLEMAELDEKRKQREELARRKEQEEAFKRGQAAEHYLGLQEQAFEFRKKVPLFDFNEEIASNREFAIMTSDLCKIPVETAYYATHPEFRQAEAEAVAKRATEAVASSVRAGQTRPAENGAQAASVGSISYKNMSREQRENLKNRIRAAAARGEHLPVGG